MSEEDLPGGSFDACVAEMQEQGNDADAAERICGTLLEETKSDNGNLDELQSAIERGQGLIADVGVDLNSAVDVPAIDSQWVAMKDANSDYNVRRTAEVVLKQDSDDAEKRISYAPAMIPREPDKEGDVVATATVENAAHDYLADHGGVDTDHNLIDGKGQVVESWIEPDARSWDLPNGETKDYPAGTWMLGIKWESEPWERIKAGELTGLSIYGQAEKVRLGKSVDKEFVVPFADESVVQVLYASRSVAAKAAERMGFEGAEEEITHPHEFGDETHYMPGPDHDSYVDAYNEFAEADGFGPVGEDGGMVEASAAKADDDPCWDGYTMVGTDENGDPRCVPDDDVPDAEGFENAKVMDGSGAPPEVRDGATPKNAAAEANKQNNTMTDDNTGGDDSPSVETLKSEIESLTDTVDTLKEAVEAEKDDGQPDSASGQMDKIVQEIQAYDEVEMSASEIRDHIKDLIAQSKADHGDDEDDDEEEKTDGESGDAAETTEKATDDANVSKAAGATNAGASTTATAKNADGSSGHDGLPSYGEAVAKYEEGN